MSTRLLFALTRRAAGPVRLVFDAQELLEPAPVTISGAAELGGLGASGVVLYDNRNPLRVSGRADTAWQRADGRSAQPPAPWDRPSAASGQPRAPWQQARGRTGAPAAPWGTPPRVAAEPLAPWQQGRTTAAAAALAYEKALALQAAKRLRWEQAQAWATLASAPHQQGLFVALDRAQPWQRALAWDALATAPHQRAAHALAELLAPWQQARPIPPGLDPVDPPQPPTPRVVDLRLVFSCPAYAQGSPVRLVFGRVCYALEPEAPLYILPARFYMAVHSLTAHRLPDNTEIPIYDATLSADAGSFGWSLSASAPVGAFDALAPAGGLPVQLRVTLDGLAFRFVVDGLQRQEAFGSRSVRISGRSPSALLAAPLARETTRTNTEARTAQQLALEALDLSGFALDWGLTDWLVPAGAWSHSGTPLGAVQAIVEAAGGYLGSARDALTLLARHPYPERPSAADGGLMAGGPWAWPLAVPDVELAPDALLVTGIERDDGPRLNAVYVSGVSQGVLARVRRTGTAGDLLAPLVTGPLITAAEVARQRGIAVLGAAGAKQRVTLELPILTGSGQPGVLDVGQLVQVNAAQPWRGMVRAVSASAAHGREVRQNVQIERHMESA